MKTKDNFREPMSMIIQYKRGRIIDYLSGDMGPEGYLFCRMDAATAYALGTKALGRDTGAYLPMTEMEYDIAVKKNAEPQPPEKPKKKIEFDPMFV